MDGRIDMGKGGWDREKGGERTGMGNFVGGLVPRRLRCACVSGRACVFVFTCVFLLELVCGRRDGWGL